MSQLSLKPYRLSLPARCCQALSCDAEPTGGPVTVTGPNGDYTTRIGIVKPSYRHPMLCAARLLLNSIALEEMNGEPFTDVGANFDRNVFMLGGASDRLEILRNIHHVVPIIQPKGDARRFAEANKGVKLGLIPSENLTKKALDASNASELLGKRHVLFVHSIYYMNSEIINAAFNAIGEKRMLAILHPLTSKNISGLAYSVKKGKDGDDTPQDGEHRFQWTKHLKTKDLLHRRECIINYRESDGMVCFDAIGNAKHYEHGLLDWLYNDFDVKVLTSVDFDSTSGKGSRRPRHMTTLKCQLVEIKKRRTVPKTSSQVIRASLLYSNDAAKFVNAINAARARELATGGPSSPPSLNDVAIAKGEMEATATFAGSFLLSSWERFKVRAWDLFYGGTVSPLNRFKVLSGQEVPAFGLMSMLYKGALFAATFSSGVVAYAAYSHVLKPLGTLFATCGTHKGVKYVQESSSCVSDIMPGLPTCPRHVDSMGLTRWINFPVHYTVYHNCVRNTEAAVRGRLIDVNTHQPPPRGWIDGRKERRRYWKQTIPNKVEPMMQYEWVQQYSGAKRDAKESGIIFEADTRRKAFSKRELTAKGTDEYGRGLACPRPIIASDASLSARTGPVFAALSKALGSLGPFPLTLDPDGPKIVYAVGYTPESLGALFQDIVDALRGDDDETSLHYYSGDFSRYDGHILDWQNAAAVATVRQCVNVEDSVFDLIRKDLKHTELKIGDRRFTIDACRRSGDDGTTNLNTIIQIEFWRWVKESCPSAFSANTYVIVGGDDSLLISVNKVDINACIAASNAWGWVLELEGCDRDHASFYSGYFVPCTFEDGLSSTTWINKPGRSLIKFAASAHPMDIKRSGEYFASVADCMKGAWRAHPIMSPFYAMALGLSEKRTSVAADAFYLRPSAVVRAYDSTWFERMYGHSETMIVDYCTEIASKYCCNFTHRPQLSSGASDLLSRLIVESGFEFSEHRDTAPDVNTVVELDNFPISQRLILSATIGAFTVFEESALFALQSLVSVAIPAELSIAILGIGFALFESHYARKENWKWKTYRIIMHTFHAYNRSHSWKRGMLSHQLWNTTCIVTNNFGILNKAAIGLLAPPECQVTSSSTSLKHSLMSGTVKEAKGHKARKAKRIADFDSLPREPMSKTASSIPGQSRVHGVLSRAAANWGKTAFQTLRGEAFPLEGGPLMDMGTTMPTAWVPLSESGTATSDPTTGVIRAVFYPDPFDTWCTPSGGGTTVFGVAGPTGGCRGFTPIRALIGSSPGTTQIESYRCTGLAVRIRAITPQLQSGGMWALALGVHEQGGPGNPSVSTLSTFPYYASGSINEITSSDGVRFPLMFASTQGDKGEYIREAFQDIYTVAGLLNTHNKYAPLIYLACDGCALGVPILQVTIEAGFECEVENRIITGGGNAANIAGSSPALGHEEASRLMARDEVRAAATESKNGDSFISRVIREAKRDASEVMDVLSPVLNEVGPMIKQAKNLGATIAPYLAALL